jgi:L-seryl-tRNA(Ser) seleniumtransferase
LADAEVPVIQMLSLTAAEVEQRAKSVIEGLKFELIAGESTLGGGAGPTSKVPTTLIAITHPEKSAQDLEHQLRTSTPPIISRISEGKVLLDLRTVFPDQLAVLHKTLKNL